MFAAGNVLINILTGDRFSNDEQVYSDEYIDFEDKKDFSMFWNEIGYTPTSDMQDLLYNMLHPNPAERFTIEQVLEHKWLKKGQYPT